MKKKLCAALLFLAALVILLNIPAWASETTPDTRVLASGECGALGNDVTCTLYRDYRLLISGVGAMYDYTSASNPPWYGYRGQIKTVEMEEGVTTVGNNAFQDCSVLDKVTLPQSLTSIGDLSFDHCVALAEITIPAKVTTIGKDAFAYCGLTKISIPEAVEQIGDNAFFKCSALTEITVNENNAAYFAADGVLFGKIGKSDTNYPLLICYPAAKEAEEYTIPDGTVKIGAYAFQGASKLKRATLPSGVTEIGEGAFKDNSALGKGPFEDNLPALELPASLTVIKDNAFVGCTSLSDNEGKSIEGTDVVFKGSRQQWSAMEIGTGNNRLTNANIVFGERKQDNVKASGECGAQGSNALWSLTEEGDFLISGAGETLNYANAASVPWANYDDGSGEGAKDLRPDIKTVTVEGSVTRNDEGVVTSEKGVTNIGDYAFYDCVNLTKVTLPPTLKKIGAQAFADCAKLTDIDLSETAVESVGDYAFNGCTALTKISFPETLKTIGKRAFLSSGLTSVTFPSGMTEIGEWAFRWCAGLTEVIMATPEDGEERRYASIGIYAFANCGALAKLTFTENMAVIGEHAFENCAELVSVHIPSGVSGIGSCAFRGCAKLEVITVDDENQFYCDWHEMLLNKDQTYIVYYPTGRTSGDCQIDLGVTGVAAFAFDGATNLQNVHYEGNETQWKTLLEPNIGDYNEPLRKAALLAEGPEEDDGANSVEIDSAILVGTGEEGRTATVNVRCGENTSGAEVFCATYDEVGRFLSLEVQVAAPGSDEEFVFSLPEDAVEVRVFALNESADNVPWCESQRQTIEE